MTTKRQPLDNQTASLCCHGWDKWQTFRRDRGTPPWIKIHRCIMTCRKWATLTDAEKGQLVSIWIVAADKNGFIPDDPRLLRKVCQLDAEPDVEKFIELQLLDRVGCQRDATVTPERRQDGAPEERREEKRRGEKKAQPSGCFVPPTIEEIKNYCLERKNNVNPNKWHDFYSSKGWMVGKNKMKDWKAAVRTWEEEKQQAKEKTQTVGGYTFDA